MQISLTPDYKKYCKAYSYLRDDPNVHFLLTNQDKVFPTHGTTYPGECWSYDIRNPLRVVSYHGAIKLSGLQLSSSPVGEAYSCERRGNEGHAGASVSLSLTLQDPGPCRTH
jgi:hypothetical protein